jgi:hypothetical protein
LITISFMPDGTNLGGSLSSNLLSSFNAKWPTALWQSQILRAAQTWAQYANLNFAVVPDDGIPFGWSGYQQGAPGEGDIRIGGFNFGGSDVVGEAWFPPPVNNYAVAGDLFFNTSVPFNIGSTYDLFTVATHELGHTLGLLESSDYYAAMYVAYVGIKSGLTADDINGIRSLYGPRSPDGFGFYTTSFQTAADLTGAFDPVTQTLVGAQLDITYPGQAEYYRFLAPYGTSSQLTVSIQSAGLSMLSPYVVLYDAYQRPIAAASGYGQCGTTVSVTVGGVVPTELYWLRVSGADTSPFGTGRYALSINFGTGPTRTVSPSNTATPNSVPSTGIGGVPEDGFDAFTRKPTQDRSTSGDSRDEPGSAHLPIPLVYSTVGQVSQGSPPGYTAQAGPGVTMTEAATVVAPPQFESRLPQPIIRRTESGGGELAEIEWHDERTCVPPEPAAEMTEFPLPQGSSLNRGWLADCTAYFMEQATVVRHHDEGGTLVPSVDKEDAAGCIDSAAALAGLTVALGGYWGGRADEVHGRRKGSFGLLARRNGLRQRD